MNICGAANGRLSCYNEKVAHSGRSIKTPEFNRFPLHVKELVKSLIGGTVSLKVN